MSGSLESVGDEGNQLAGDLAFAGLCESGGLQLAINHGDGVVFAVEADVRVGEDNTISSPW